MNDNTNNTLALPVDNRDLNKVIARHEKLLLPFINSLRSDIQFHRVTVWAQVYEKLGIQSQAQQDNRFNKVTLKEYNEFIKQYLTSKRAEWTREYQRGTDHARDTAGEPASPDTEATEERQRSTLEIAEDQRRCSELLNVLKREYNKPLGFGGSDTLTTNNDPYWYVPKQTVSLFKPQLRAARALLHDIIVKRRPASILHAPTGCGKTFMYCQLLAWLKAIDYYKNKTLAITPACIVTATPIIFQTERVASQCFGLSPTRDVMVTSYDALRSKFGKQIILTKEEVVNGELTKSYEWCTPIRPIVMIWDECQKLKNDTSTQHKIGASYNEDPSQQAIELGFGTRTWQLFTSATLLMRVADAKCMSVACQVNIGDNRIL